MENAKICKTQVPRNFRRKLLIHVTTDHGSCHCGAVTIALKSKPLETLDISKDEERIIDCNCSICVRVT